jgi:hypothetical protein
MKFANPFTDEEMAKASEKPTTPDLAIDAWTCGIDFYVQFMKEFLPPGLHGFQPKSAREAAVLDLYTGILGFLVCVFRLRGDWHVQGIATCSRSMFELYNDLLLLTQDPTDVAAQRYHAFVHVEHLGKARKRLAFFVKHPGATDFGTIEALQEFIARDGSAIEETVAALWDRPPAHWSGIRGGEARARAAGIECETLYFQFYSTLSWFVHTASVATFGLSREKLKGQIPRSLELVRQIVPPTFGIVARELAIEIPELEAKIAFLRHVFYLRLVGLKIGDPDRLTFAFSGRGSRAWF